MRQREWRKREAYRRAVRHVSEFGDQETRRLVESVVDRESYRHALAEIVRHIDVRESFRFTRTRKWQKQKHGPVTPMIWTGRFWVRDCERLFDDRFLGYRGPEGDRHPGGSQSRYYEERRTQRILSEHWSSKPKLVGGVEVYEKKYRTRKGPPSVWEGDERDWAFEFTAHMRNEKRGKTPNMKRAATSEAGARALRHLRDQPKKQGLDRLSTLKAALDLGVAPHERTCWQCQRFITDCKMLANHPAEPVTVQIAVKWYY